MLVRLTRSENLGFAERDRKRSQSYGLREGAEVSERLHTLGAGLGLQHVEFSCAAVSASTECGAADKRGGRPNFG